MTGDGDYTVTLIIQQSMVCATYISVFSYLDSSEWSKSLEPLRHYGTRLAHVLVTDHPSKPTRLDSAENIGMSSTLSNTGEDHVNISNKKSLFLKNYIKPVSLKASSMHADIIPCFKTYLRWHTSLHHPC